MLVHLNQRKQGRMMIKDFVFDMGHVCIDWNPRKISQSISPVYAYEIENYLFKSQTWLLLDQGLISIEDGLNQILEITFGEYHEIITYAYDHWHEYVDVLEETHLFIQQLKQQGYGIYLLSNCSQMFYKYYQNMNIFNDFNGYYISADSKLLIPDVLIYQDFLRTFNLRGEECFFIDEVLVNVEGARKAGMMAFQFKKILLLYQRQSQKLLYLV